MDYETEEILNGIRGNDSKEEEERDTREDDE